MSSFLDRLDQLAICDPRVGLLFFLGMSHELRSHAYLSIIDGATGLWLLILGLVIMLGKRRTWVKVYIGSELVLAAPTAFILIISVGEGADYAPGYLAAGFVVFCFFTAVPLFLASRILVKGDAV